MTATALSIRPIPPAPSGSDTPHVTLTQVSRSYGALHALGPIDLALRRGEFFSVVGPSGCGKSTLLDLLAGLNAPSSGTIDFEGKPVAGVVPEGEARRSPPLLRPSGVSRLRAVIDAFGEPLVLQRYCS